MRFGARALLACGLMFEALVSGQAQSYRQELDLGVAAYKKSDYEQAILHFRRATEIDPSQTTAHLYLATSYNSQFIPGLDDPANLETAKLAIEQYQFVLDSSAELEPRLTSAKGLGYIYLNMKKWDEAKRYYGMASDIDPNDAENYYSVGVIDWTACSMPRMEARARLGMRPDQHLNWKMPEEKRVCDNLLTANSALIEDGISNLSRAIELRPDYDDAMAYLNLMYRERADLECQDSIARDADLKTADEWVDKAMAVKKAKARRARGPSPQ